MLTLKGKISDEYRQIHAADGYEKNNLLIYVPGILLLFRMR